MRHRVPAGYLTMSSGTMVHHAAIHCQYYQTIRAAVQLADISMVPMHPGKSWNLRKEFSRPGKSWKNDCGHGKSWNSCNRSWIV